MYMIDWRSHPESLDSREHEDLLGALHAISTCVAAVRGLMAIEPGKFDAAQFLQQFLSLKEDLGIAGRLLMPLRYELDPIAQPHGLVKLGEAVGGNHLSAARNWVVRYCSAVTEWSYDYMCAMDNVDVPLYTPDAFEWARERILAVPENIAPVAWVRWQAAAEQEVVAAIAKRNALLERGLEPPRIGYGCVGPVPVANAPPFCLVRLRGMGQKPFVNGVEVDQLSEPRYAVVKALFDAGPDGLTKKDLEKVKGDAVKYLRELSKLPYWKGVILMPGAAWGRYAIKHA